MPQSVQTVLRVLRRRTHSGDDHRLRHGQRERRLERHRQLARAVLVAEVLPLGARLDARLQSHQRRVDLGAFLSSTRRVVHAVDAVFTSG